MSTIISKISTNHTYFIIISLTAFTVFILSIVMIKRKIQKTLEKNDFSLLSLNNKRNYKIILDDYMKSKKPYLNANLSLSDVANEMSVSEQFIDNIIQKSFKNSFDNYVNKLRIDECICTLLEASNPNINMGDLFLKSGFDSFESFHKNFTHRVGMTPEAFKNKISSFSLN